MKNAESSQLVFYRPELDCLRFFAFLTVFVSHAFSISPEYYTQRGFSSALSTWISKAISSGGLGVVLFFVLSSYLITELLIRETDRMGSIDIKSFYIRRALRIWPLYFVFLTLIYLILPQESRYSLKTGFFISMLLFVGNWASVFWGGMAESVAGPLWSISVEEQFYLAWPLILSRIGVSHLKTACISLIVLANAVRIIMEKKGAGFVAFWCSTVTWLDAIAAGALIALWLRGTTPQRSLKVRWLLGVGGLCLWVTTVRLSRLFIYPDIIFFPLTIIGSCMVLLAVLGSQFRNAVLIHLGRMSYGLYVVHAAALALTSLIFVKYTVRHAVVGLAITIVMGTISYYCLEKPFLRLKRRFTYVVSEPTVMEDVASSKVSEGAAV